MKRKDFLHTAIILPVILGLVLCVAFSLFFYLRPQTVLPFEQGKTFAYFDETLDKTVTASSENEVLSLAPDCKNSLVVYYEKTASVGFSSKYTAHIYKGVQ